MFDADRQASSKQEQLLGYVWRSPTGNQSNGTVIYLSCVKVSDIPSFR